MVSPNINRKGVAKQPLDNKLAVASGTTRNGSGHSGNLAVKHVRKRKRSRRNHLPHVMALLVGFEFRTIDDLERRNVSWEKWKSTLRASQ